MKRWAWNAGIVCTRRSRKRFLTFLKPSRERTPHYRGQRLHEGRARSAFTLALDPGLLSLGTDGFGRSDNREYLRRHFEVNAESIVAATLSRLAREGKFDQARAQEAFTELGLETETADPATPVVRGSVGFLPAF